MSYVTRDRYDKKLLFFHVFGQVYPREPQAVSILARVERSSVHAVCMYLYIREVDTIYAYWQGIFQFEKIHTFCLKSPLTVKYFTIN